LWSLAPAVIALVGVVVGVLATGGVDYVRADRESAADLRQAKRLVALEVGNNAISLAHLDVNRVEAPNGFHSTMWEKYRTLLARELSEDDWFLVSMFYEDVEDARVTVARSPLTTLPDADLYGVRAARRDAEEVRVRFGESPTGLLETVGTRRIPYRPSREERNPDWPEFARSFYRAEFDGSE
jgi:hypothetical protein